MSWLPPRHYFDEAEVRDVIGRRVATSTCRCGGRAQSQESLELQPYGSVVVETRLQNSRKDDLQYCHDSLLYIRPRLKTPSMRARLEGDRFQLSASCEEFSPKGRH